VTGFSQSEPRISVDRGPLPYTADRHTWLEPGNHAV